MAQAGEAFSAMAKARHIGKIVLLPAAASASSVSVSPDATYLVTGGFGALGLQVAGWLAERGARHLVLVGRRGPSPSAAPLVENWRSKGVTITPALLDVADAAAVGTLIAGIDATGLPLRGVVHAAGILDDGVLLEQGWDRFERVLRPKAVGALNLHHCTRTHDLDFFVLFSAGAAVLGSPGQAGYCAANLVVDSLAESRRRAGLPATSIAWGSWGGAGMAAALSGRNAQRWLERGVTPLAVADAVQLLEQALAQPAAAVAAIDVDWRRFLSVGPTRPRFDALLAPVAPAATASVELRPADSSLLNRLRCLSGNDRLDALRSFLERQVRTALAVDASTPLDERQPLKELGLDSLMAVELRNALAAALGMALPVTLLFDFPTMERLCLHLAGKLPGSNGATTADAAGRAEPEDRDAMAIHELSDVEAESLLLAELEDSERG
jgi:NAD(P)-dependent dehydrogenase (short-subunit alcohol dehydrogenase family)/acyl carrier protein